MSDIFEQFRTGNQEGDGPEFTRMTEADRFCFLPPSVAEDLVVEQTVTEEIDGTTLVKTKVHSVVQAACGQLCSWSPDSRLKPPAGRCRSCGMFICSECVADRLSCCVCHKPLCPACSRPYKDSQYCTEDFERLVGSRLEEDVKGDLK